MDISLSELSGVKGIGKKTIQRIREYKLADEGYTSEYDENLHLDRNSVNQGDCLELMNGIPDKSIDMILADLPYGTTACSWDSVIPLDKLWLQYERIIKDNGAIVLTASQPFTTKLINSNLSLFKYCWYWNKKIPSGMSYCRYQPMRQIEEVVVFGKNKTKYNPQMTKRDKPIKQGGNKYSETAPIQARKNNKKHKKTYKFKNPISLIKFQKIRQKSKHPTQKPVALFEYLIKTYTNKDDLVLDNVIGSGTTAVACLKTDRKFIGFEQEEEYYNIALKRIGKFDKEYYEELPEEEQPAQLQMF